MRRVVLSEVANIDRRNIAPENIVGGTQYLGLEHIQSEGGCNPVKVAAGELGSNKFAFTPDHVLFGKLRPYLKKTTLVDFHGICSTDIIPILPDPEQIDKRYLYYFLLSEDTVRKAVERCSGANLPRLSPTELAKFEIPLPPLPEQRRIAARLDAADRLRALDRALVGKYEEMKRSLFLEMFGDPVRNERGWPTAPLSDYAEVLSGITKGRKQRAGEEYREVPYMRVANVQDKFLDLSEVKTIAASQSEIDRYRIKQGDLLLTEGGDPDKLGRGAVWDVEISDAICQNHVFRVRVKGSSLEPVYLQWLIGSDYGKRYFLSVAKQTTGIATINKTQLLQFPTQIANIKFQYLFRAKLKVICESMKFLYINSADSDFIIQNLISESYQHKKPI